MGTKGIVSIGLAVVIFFTGIIGFFTFTETINQGHAGVVYNRSHGVEETTLGQGLHFVNPLERITEYPVSTETVKNAVSLATKDGKSLSVDLTYDYLNDIEKLPYIYNKFKGQSPKSIEETWLQARLRDSALTVTSKYTILQIFQEREAISVAIEEQFRKDVGEHGFLIENVVFGTPEPDANTAQAIQAVVDAQQQLEALKIEKAKATEVAEKQLIESKGKADAQVAEAEGQAKANHLIQQSITPELLKKMEMEARQAHGWVEIQGISEAIVDTKK